jgi:hypothetical protein
MPARMLTLPEVEEAPRKYTVSVNENLVLHTKRLIADRHGRPLSILFLPANSVQARGTAGRGKALPAPAIYRGWLCLPDLNPILRNWNELLPAPRLGPDRISCESSLFIVRYSRC